MQGCGIVLAGGTGSRLGLLTKVINKHLLPVGNEPMIYHQLRKLIGGGITDILVVSGAEHAGGFLHLLGSGSKLGCKLTYKVQDEAGGIAQALGLAEEFANNRRVFVMLGDNIYYDPLDKLFELPYLADNPLWAALSLKRVSNPERFGVAKFTNGIISKIEEKPDNAGPFGYAVTGAYSYPADVFGVVKRLKPSGRGELEITDVNNHYLAARRLHCMTLENYWTDAGTLESLHNANMLVADKPPLF